jgi:hypothetical protein
MEAFIHVVDAFIILNAEGKRLYSKYYTNNVKEASREQFENKIHKNINTKQVDISDTNIVQIDGRTVIYQIEKDVILCVIGPLQENELVLCEVLTALTLSLRTLLRNQVETRTIMENFELLLLSIDEIVDGGIIIETEPDMISNRVLNAIGESSGSVAGEAEVISQAKDAYKSIREQVSGFVKRDFFGF